MSDDQPGFYSGRSTEPARPGPVPYPETHHGFVNRLLWERDRDRAEIKRLTAERDQARRDLDAFFDAMIARVDQGYYITFGSLLALLEGEGLPSRDAAIGRLREGFGLGTEGGR